MTISTISAKGAIVIPASVRKKLGIGPGSKVAVSESDGRVQIIRVSDDPVQSLRGSLKTRKSAHQLLHDARMNENRRDKTLAKPAA